MCAEKNQTTDDEQQRAAKKNRTHKTAKRERCLRDCVDCSHFMRPEYEAKIAHNVFIITKYLYTQRAGHTALWFPARWKQLRTEAPNLAVHTQPNVVARFHSMRPDRSIRSGCWSLATILWPLLFRHLVSFMGWPDN